MVEDVLVLQKQLVTRRLLVCLNPCCGGRCSSTPNILGITNPFGVLILVVVEDVLVLIQQTTFNKQQVVLILVVVEDVLVLSQAVVVLEHLPPQQGLRPFQSKTIITTCERTRTSSTTTRIKTHMACSLLRCS